MILLYMIALSVLVGYIRGGRLKHYLDKPLSGVFLPVVAFALEAAIPLGATAEPEQIGEVVVFLAGDAASYITGTTVIVDGGLMQSSPGL